MMNATTNGPTCRACGSDILWARTTAGKLQPIDPERRDRHDTSAPLAVHRDHHGRLRVRVLAEGMDPEPWETRGMPHAATCQLRVEARQAQLRADGVLPFRRRSA